MAANPKPKAKASRASAKKNTKSKPSTEPPHSGAARQALASALDAHLTERRRVARVLHDEIGPTLSAIGFQLDAVSYEHPGVAPRTAELQSSLDKAMDRIRLLSQELSTSLVDRAGLRMALEELIKGHEAASKSAAALTWSTTERLPGPVALGFFDIAELALDNVRKHSAASRVSVAVRGKKSVTMEIRDNGRGFNAAKLRHRGLGILQMQEAARRIGATFSIDSVAGGSTIVKLLYAPPSPPRR